VAEPVTGEEWQKLGSAEQAVTPILDCLGCGRTKTALDGDVTDIIPAQHCADCPPWRCDGCGEMDSVAEKCSCWIDLTTMAHADVKALFAEDGTFNVAPDGTLSIGRDGGCGHG
jgi:hypothetical protein